MFQNVTLELSLKPFKKTDAAYIRHICAEIFTQWRPLLKNRSTISLMLWVGDGSEILDYAKDLSASFEWGRFIGTANLPPLEENEPLETSLHTKRQDYIPDAPQMTYGILKMIIACLKDEGKKAFPEATIRVGATFDIGPEFAISDFKYCRHPEICSGEKLEHFGFVDATSALHADTRAYAAYPDGIPEGTLFGTFLGKQSNIYLKDLGYDYLWLSNGLGFSASPWKKTGKIFDGERYYPEKLAQTKESVFSFWKLFRKSCPDLPLETRGTNNSVGIDYASDGVPLHDIYHADLDITAPPNSPWAALNDNFGLEMMGHMTRICELPNERFPFRYYIHDPWWVNSPWYDRYDGSPCDIYLPMAISRITAQGKIETANSLNILSIDNSHGEMPDACVNEPLPHLLKAEKDAADEPAPLVWVYPMREYTTTSDSAMLREMNLGDHFVCDAINDGLPLCCVTSTDAFLCHDASLYQKSILLSPIPTERAVYEKLSALSAEGVRVMIYGTKEMRAAAPIPEGAIFLDVEEKPSAARETLASLGYSIHFRKQSERQKPPTIALSRNDNALIFSVYNSNTTSDAHFHFPFGAPILCGMEAELKDHASVYRFSRAEHRECRVFVDQAEGVISCREAPPVNARYRRAIRISGFKNATVRLFSEKGCECIVSTIRSTNEMPIADPRFEQVHDPIYGTYLEGKNISGHIYFLIGHKKP